MELRKKSINGFFWTFIDVLINKGSFFFATIVLANVLGPKEFGLLGMIMLFVSIGNTLVDGGMSTSLIRTNQVTEKEYATVFITNIIMSIIVYIILFFLAPFVSKFYNQPILVDVIRWYCLGFVINSFRSIHLVKLAKEMEFKKITFLNLPGNIISVIISIWMGYAGYGIWSLVFLFLLNQFFSTLVIWLFMKWKPEFTFDFANYKYHFRFGYKLVLSSQINTIFENIYNVLIGKFYSINSLGFYERAYTFNNYPVSILSSIILKVTLPSLTHLKNDKKRLQHAYKDIMQITFFITIIGLGFASLLAGQIIELVLGEKWLAIVPLFQVLSISFMFYPIHSLNINILSVFGRSDLFLRLEIVKKLILLIILSICFNFGIMGLVWCSVINSVLALLINTYYSGKFLNYTTISQVKDLVPSIGVVLSTILIVYSSQLFIGSTNLAVQIIQSFLIGLFVIISICEITKLHPYVQIKQLILVQIKKY